MKQLGFSLIEVLLALMIFSLSMLVAIKVQTQSERQAQASHLQMQAAIEVEYAVAAIKSGNNQFLTQWQEAVAKKLPQGKASLIKKANELLIQLSWFDPVSKASTGLSYAVPISNW
ncbi:MAG: hypothetical protein K0R66_373 [Gammaproteobacteria bacterium]|jgi:prepilin-type N-terminal cleavage/methylation domain-containing protein|nr:hypothetical protein [Gammaproteobacteria bacterium]